MKLLEDNFRVFGLKLEVLAKLENLQSDRKIKVGIWSPSGLSYVWA